MLKMHPATKYWSAIVATGIPVTATRTFDEIVCTRPPCGHIATAPT
jgi:hypothetical protein